MAQEQALAVIRKNKPRLDALMEQVNALHREVVAAMRLGAVTAFAAGKVLSEAKEMCPHGYYEKWIEENADFAPSTARTYKSLYEHKDELIEDHGTEIYVKPISSIIKLIRHSPKEGKTLEPSVLDESKPKATTTLKPVDGTDECPHGGSHTYDEEACTRCHDPRPDTHHEIRTEPQDQDTEQDDAGPGCGSSDQGEVGQAPGSEQVAQRELCNSYSVADKAFGELIRALDVCNTKSAMKRRLNMVETMEILYQDFRAERKEKHAWRQK